MTEKTPSTNKEYEAWVDAEVKRYIGILLSDPRMMALVLRFHLLTEGLLNRIIAANLKRADRLLDDARLSYPQKLSLVDSFAVLEDDVTAVLRELNGLRNKLAHNPEHTIVRKDLERVAQSFAERAQEQGDTDEKFLGAVIGRIFAKLLEPLFEYEVLSSQRPST